MRQRSSIPSGRRCSIWCERVAAGADRFITENRKDFSREIDEIDIVYPDMLR